MPLVRVRSARQLSVGESIQHDVFGKGVVVGIREVQLAKTQTDGREPFADRVVCSFENEPTDRYVDPSARHLWREANGRYATDVEFPAVNRRPVDASDEPWRAYVRQVGRIEAATSETFLLSFFERYAEATGQIISDDAKGLHVYNWQEGNKWGVTLSLHLPSDYIPEDMPVKPRKIKGNGYVIYNNKLAWELLDNGMVLG